MGRPVISRSHDDGVDRWAMVSAEPAAHLSRFVDHYGDYWERTGSFSARRELASTAGVLIVNLGDPLEIVAADGRTIRFGAGQGFAGGLADATSISRSGGAQAGVHIHAPLNTIGRILGCPPSQIVNRVVTLAEALGGMADMLGERLAGATTAEERFDLLDAFLATRLAATTEPDPRLVLASGALRRDPGVRVAELAERLNLERRDLARRFRREVGVSPRHYARIARFEAFVAAISAAPAAPLADLATEIGYFDQPHLCRDVQVFAAMTPTDLRARVVPGGGGIRDD